MRRWIRNNGLTLVLGLFFLISFLGQFYFGFHSYNQELQRHGEAVLTTYSAYLTHGHFLSSIGENWESEFLQMGFFVLLTAFLFQKGSSESKAIPEQEKFNDVLTRRNEATFRKKKLAEYPLLWRIYESSLTVTLFFLFIVSFYIHMLGRFRLTNEERRVFHEVPLNSVWSVLSENEFWFESLQNWQSEFFSIAVLLVLSIYFRQVGSPQSKKIYDSNEKTGTG